ncbi:hypothetical protein BDV38DRAFT_277990 [Aspergillus pseudotamarii]|uniref:Uncharacterized protein n=1 Tax=Aspergillus pseudotamarii TaxID=132259 RepID=A0A5N6T803_ASPPS|nr:uncharacterized protein BDV38DRAFT_277990 [Aspergillus pseudotamarii]KAE8142463.1 hypothetical protein BDV38DRAFT_277990 [Aspergillus pseudotamarii]
MPDYPAAYVQALRAAGLTTRSTHEDIALLDEESLKDLLVSLLQVLNTLEAAGTSTHMIQGFLRPILPHQQVRIENRLGKVSTPEIRTDHKSAEAGPSQPTARVTRSASAAAEGSSSSFPSSKGKEKERSTAEIEKIEMKKVEWE